MVAGFCGGNAGRIISLILILLGVIIVICCVPVWMWLTLLGIALIVFGRRACARLGGGLIEDLLFQGAYLSSRNT